MTPREACTSRAEAERDQRVDLERAAVNGFASSYGAFVVAKLFALVTTAILARLLTPDDFGLVGYALVFVGYLDLARDLGIGEALIAQSRLDSRIASTAFQISVAWGLLLAAGLNLAAPLLGEYFLEPRVIPVARLLSLGFILSGASSTQEALLYRRLAFSRRAIPDVTRTVVKGLTSVILALAGAGYWSLVIGQLASQVAFSVVVWLVQPFRPRFEWDGAAARRLLGFGSAIVGVSLTTACLPYLTALVAGHELGAAALGLYTLAYSLPTVVLTQTFSILSTVLFPIYAQLGPDAPGLRRGYLLAQRCTALFGLPAGTALALLAPLLIRVLYGPSWVEATATMQLLTLAGAATAIGWQAGDVARALGRARLQLLLLVATVLVTSPAMPFAALNFGLVGLAAVRASACLLGGLLATLMMRSLIGLPVRQALLALGPAAAAAIAVGGVVAGLLLVTAGWPDLARLSAAVVLGAATYVGAVYALAPDFIRALTGAVRQRRADAGATPPPVR